MKIYLYFCVKHHKLLQSSLFPLIQGIVSLLCENCSLQQSSAVPFYAPKSWESPKMPSENDHWCYTRLGTFWVGANWQRQNLSQHGNDNTVKTASRSCLYPNVTSQSNGWHLLWKYIPCFYKRALYVSVGMGDTVSQENVSKEKIRTC